MAFLFYSSKLYIIKLKKIPKYDKFNIGAKPRKVFNMEERKDKTIICKDCGKEFVFTVGEQEFYAEKGFQNEPVRCKECRVARKERRNQERQN